MTWNSRVARRASMLAFALVPLAIALPAGAAFLPAGAAFTSPATSAIPESNSRNSSVEIATTKTATSASGSVLAWGCSGADFGQCTSVVTAIAAGTYHSLALKGEGRVLAWGCGGAYNFGQCTVLGSAASGVTAIVAGAYHSLALKNGGVLAWGCVGGDSGQCSAPAAATSAVTGIAAGDHHSLALKSATCRSAPRAP